MPFQSQLGSTGSNINCSRMLPGKLKKGTCVPFSAHAHSNFFLGFLESGGYSCIISGSFISSLSVVILYIGNEYFSLNLSQENISIRCCVRFQRGFWRITLLRWVFLSVFVYVSVFFFPFLSKRGRWGCSVIRKETICVVDIRRKQLKSLYFSIFFYLFIADSEGVAEC